MKTHTRLAARIGRMVGAWILVLALFAASTGSLTPAVAAEAGLVRAEQKISPALRAQMAAAQGEPVTIIITMRQQASLSGLDGLPREEKVRRVVETLQQTAAANQAAIRRFLERKRAEKVVTQVQPYWIFNGIAVTTTSPVIQMIAQRSDVLQITTNQTFDAPAPNATTAAVEPNLAFINAPALWDAGKRGQGVVVATLDTGVSYSHPDLLPRWRGGSNSWYDPYGEHPSTPVDLNGHGTQTLGIIVGGADGGTAIGVAPEAQWIAAKIFNDQGQATSTAIHAAYQWLLDPDGNPATSDAPHVVNNSWGESSPGCNLNFQLDLQALRAANILPVFSAGNTGPNPASSTSPANNPEAFAVGAVDNTGGNYNLSARGPASCGGVETVFPKLVSPGVQIHTTERYNSYTEATGTSMAAPHVTGAVALLLSAYPDLTVSEQETALLAGAQDLGDPGPDPVYGYGALNILAAFQTLDGRPTPTPTVELPTATPTSTPTTAPTATATATLPPAATSTPATAVDLARNRPVAVSTSLNTTYNGPKAVDGNPATYWQTRQASAFSPTAEYIRVDIGSSQPVGLVVLEWGSAYATHFSIDTSPNNSTWTTVWSTTTGDGGRDEIAFNPVAARYVRVRSTGWSDSTVRLRLNTLELYAGGGTLPQPTATLAAPTATATTAAPTATSTRQPSATPTRTPAATNTSQPSATSTPTAPATPTRTPTAAPSATAGTASVHIGDLDGSTTTGTLGRWNAVVTITVHGANETPAAGVTVTGAWSSGATGSGSCTTGTNGTCQIVKSGLWSFTSRVTFTVTGASGSGVSYQPAANHDADGDSSGTAVSINR